MNGVQTRFKCKLDVKRCKRFVFPPSSLLPRSNALKTKAIRYFQTDQTLTRIVSSPLYTTAMMDIVLPGAAAHGYTTDNCVTSNNLPAGRPQPYMIYQNMIDLAIPSVQSVIKYGDTIADIKEGVNAGVWTVGVILGSNEMGLTQEETGKLPAEELNRRMAAVRKRMYMAGAHYVVNTIAELPEIIEIINHKMN